MATIQKVKRKKGYAFVAIINKKGVKSFSKTFRKSRDARAWAERIESDVEYLEARGLSSSASITFHKLSLQFEGQYNKKDHSLINKLRYWDSCLGHIPMYDLTEDKIRAEMRTIAETPVQVGNGRSTSRNGSTKRTSSTINSYKAALSALCNYAIEQGALRKNPCLGIKNLPLNNRRERHLTPQEVQDLLEACKRSESKLLYLLVLMAVTTGARQGELLGLRWKYVDLKNSVAHLPDTKNGTSRDLALSEPVRTALRAMQGIGDALVFPSDRASDKPFEFRKYWDIALVESGINIGEGKYKVVFHTLRHTAASYLVMNGISSLEVAGIMGHKSLQTTLRYTHTDHDSKKKVIDSVMGEIK